MIATREALSIQYYGKSFEDRQPPTLNHEPQLVYKNREVHRTRTITFPPAKCCHALDRRKPCYRGTESSTLQKYT